MPFADVVTKVKPAVVGMGILRDPRDPFSAIIIGTGFFVDRHGTILTNRHVAEHFIKERDGNIGVRRDIARAVVFVPRTVCRYGRIASPTSASTGSAKATRCSTLLSDGKETTSPSSPTRCARPRNARRTRSRAPGSASGATSAVATPNPAAHSPNTCSSVDTVDR